MKKPTVPTILIHISGGVCQAIAADASIRVILFDEDVLRDENGLNSTERDAFLTSLCSERGLHEHEDAWENADELPEANP